MFGLLSGAKVALVTAIFSLLAGAGLGLWLGKAIWNSDSISNVAKVRVEVIESNDNTAKAEVALEEKREQIRTEIKYITKEVVKYVPVTQDASDCQLSVGAVGLLNAARTGTDFQPSAYLDAQIKAASGIGLLELSVADIELAEQYRQLAADHDALVEYVEDYQRRLKEAANQ